MIDSGQPPENMPPGVPDRVVQALSHPYRIRLLAALEQSESSVDRLMGEVGYGSRASTSYHLRVLHHAGLAEIAGTNSSEETTDTVYRVNRDLFLDPLYRAHMAAIEPDEHLVLNWTGVNVDGVGWDQVVDLLRATRHALLLIEEQSNSRREATGEGHVTLTVGVAALKPMDKKS